MADERLRLTAEVTDAFSGPLGKLETALGRTARAGSQAGKDLKRDFEGFHGVLGKTTSALQGMTGPLSALGMAGLGAGLSLTAVGSALRSFSSSTQQLSMLSRETGIATDSLRAFGQLGERFGIQSRDMLGYADNFSRAARDIKRNWGEAVQSMRGSNLEWMLKDLQSATSVEDMMNRALKALPKITNIDARRRMSVLLFGTEDVGRIASELGDKLGDTLREIREHIGTLDKDTERAAKDFERHMSRIGEAAERAKLQTIGPLLRGTVDMLDFGTGGDKGKLDYLKRERDQLDAQAGKSDPDSFKGKYFRNRREAVDTEIRDLEKAIREGAAKGSEQGVNKALRDNQGGATVQQQSFSGPLSGSGFAGAVVQRAGYGSGVGGPLSTQGGGYGGGAGSALRGGGGALSPRASSGPLGSPRMSPTAPIPDLGTGGRRGRGATSAEGRENVASWMGFFQRPKDEGGMGLPPDKARAMVAMLQGESGANLNPRSFNPNDVNGPSGGTAQWHDRFGRKERLSALRDFATARGKPWNDRGVQQEFLRHEMETTHRGALRAIEAAPDGPGALYAGISKFENPADHAGEFRKRMANYRALDGSVASPSGPAAEAPGFGQRPGDAVMRRFYGDEAPSAKPGMLNGNAKIDLHLHGFPNGTKARTSMEGLFSEVTTSRHRAPEMTNL